MAEGINLGSILGAITGGGGGDPNSAEIAQNTANTVSEITGLHSSVGQLEQAFRDMPIQFQKQYDELTKITEGLKNLTQVTEKSARTAKERLATQSQKGKKKPDEGEVAKLPDIYSQPALLLKSVLDDMLKEIGKISGTIKGALGGLGKKTGEKDDGSADQINQTMGGLEAQMAQITQIMEDNGMSQDSGFASVAEGFRESCESLKVQVKDSLGEMSDEVSEVAGTEAEPSGQVLDLLNNVNSILMGWDNAGGYFDWIKQTVVGIENALAQANEKGDTSDFHDRVLQSLAGIESQLGQSAQAAGAQTVKLPEGGDDKKEEGEKKKASGLKDVLNDMLAGAKGIAQLAVGLIAFAGAALVLSVIAWGPALIGLAMFALFVVGSIKIAAMVGDQDPKQLEAVQNYAMGMSLAFMLFSLAMGLAALITVIAGPAILGSIMIMAFFLGFTAIATKIALMAKGVEADKLDETKKGKSPLGDFIQAVLALSGALILFAIAMLLSAMIGPIVIAGILGIFTVMAFFIVFAILGVIVSHLTKKGGGFDEFCKGIFFLSAALLLFAITMVVLNFVYVNFMKKPSFWEGPILIMGLFLAFALIGAIINRIAGEGIKDFAIASILLTVALVVFSLGLLVLNWVYNELMTKGGPMVGFGDYLIPFSVVCIMGLFLALIVVSAIASRVAKDIIMFALASILMAVALVVFSIALNMLIDLKLSDPQRFADLMLSLIVVGAILIGLVILGTIAKETIVQIIMFTIASILIAVALIVFSIALQKLIDLDLFNPQRAADLLASLIFISVIMVAAAAVGYASVAAIVGIGIFVVAALLLSGALIVLSIALQRLMDLNLWNVQNALNVVASLAFITVIFVGAAAIGWASIIAMPGIILFSVASLLLGGALMVMAGALQKLIDLNLSTKESRERVSNGLGAILDVMKTAGAMGLAAAIALPFMMPFIVASLALGGALMLMGSAIETLLRLDKKIQEDPEALDRVMPRIKELMKMVSSTASEMKGMSLEAAIAFKVILDATLGGVERIMGMMDALADPKILQKMDKAKIGFDAIVSKFFGVNPVTGLWNEEPLTLIGLVNTIGKSVDGMSEGQLRAAQAMVPLTEALSTISDMIIKIQGVDTETGVAAIKSMIPLLEELANFATIFKGKSSESGGVFGKIGAKLFGEGDSASQYDIAAKSMEAMHPMIDAIEKIMNKVSTFKSAAPDAIEGVRQSIDLLSALSDFAGSFKGEKAGAMGVIGAALFGKSDTKSTIDVAISSMESMTGMIDTMQDVITRASALQGKALQAANGIKQSMELVGWITVFAASFTGYDKGIQGAVGAFFFGKNDTKTNIRIATAAVYELTGLVDEVANLSDHANKIQIANSFQDLGDMFKNDIITPMLELDQAIQSVEKFTKSMKTLSQTLRVFVKDNEGTLKQTGGLLQKAHTFAMDVAATLKYKASGGGSGGAQQQQGNDPLDNIANNVAAIAKKFTAPGVKEWGGPTR